MDAGSGSLMEAAPCGCAAAGRLKLQVEKVTSSEKEKEASACFLTVQRGGCVCGLFHEMEAEAP